MYLVVPDQVGSNGMRSGPLIWAALAAALCVPVAAAAASPLLAWRGPVYVLAGFAGITALGLVLVQPLLIAGYLPGLSAYRGRRAHHWIGGALVVNDDDELAENLAREVKSLFEDLERLAAMGQRARSSVFPDAAARVARVCFDVAQMEN